MKNSIIFDFNRTLYDPETKKLLPSAVFVLQGLHMRGHKLYLVSRKENNRENLIKELGIEKYFSATAFFQEKTKEAFEEFMQRNSISANGSFIIGDRTREEIAIGNALGMQTIWLQNGKFAGELPRSKEEKPTFRVARLEEILKIAP